MTAEEQTKKCPFCAETIKAEAIVCRYCGRDLPQKSEGISHEESKKPETTVKLSSIATQSTKITAVFTLIALVGSLINGNPLRLDIIIIGFLLWWVIIAGIIFLWRKHKYGFIIAIAVGLIGLVAMIFLPNINLFQPIQNTSIPTPRLGAIEKLRKDNCINWNEVTKKDMGQIKCVYGNANGNGVETFNTTLGTYTLAYLYFAVNETTPPSNFYIILNEIDENGIGTIDFSRVVNLGNCVYARGLISADVNGALLIDARNQGVRSCELY